jgi:hypothetical protein
MSVKEYGSVSDEEASKIWKEKYAIPLGIMGTAQDYAQTVISTITVSRFLPLRSAFLVTDSVCS